MTYPLATLAPTISDAGISAPTYYDIWQSLLATYRNIFGADAYLEPDSKDGQWIAALAQAIHESNQAALATFNSFSPTFAYGAALASRVKINGLTVRSATRSTAIGVASGVAGTRITGGKVRDINGRLWSLPLEVLIGASGTTTVTVTADDVGASRAEIGEIAEIYNPQFGWQGFSNTFAAVPGAAVETDAELRLRQARSTALPSQAVLDGMYAALADLPGVTRAQVYENPTDTVDVNGLPAHSISAVVEGGDSAEIAATIARKKTAGAATYGAVGVLVQDLRGVEETINYFPLVSRRCYINVTVKALAGFSGAVPEKIADELVRHVSELAIGEDLYYTQLVAAASLPGTADSGTFYLPALTLGLTPVPEGSANVTIAFNEAATLAIDDIVVTVT